MSVDAATVRRIAHLARIAVTDEEVAPLGDELNAILSFIEELAAVNVDDVAPLTSVMPMAMKMRVDTITDGGMAEVILRNAPSTEDGYYLVPKVIE